MTIMTMMSDLWQEVESAWSEPQRPNQTENVAYKNQMEAVKQTSGSLSEEFISTQWKTLKTFFKV